MSLSHFEPRSWGNNTSNSNTKSKMSFIIVNLSQTHKKECYVTVCDSG